MDFLNKKFRYAIIATLLCAPIASAQQSETQDRAGNPLRLTATMPLAPTVDTSAQNFESSSNPNPESAGIPFEIRKIIYPNQESSTQYELVPTTPTQVNSTQRQSTQIIVVDPDSIEPTATPALPAEPLAGTSNSAFGYQTFGGRQSDSPTHLRPIANDESPAVVSQGNQFNPSNAVQPANHIEPLEPEIISPVHGGFARLPRVNPNLGSNANNSHNAHPGQTLESLLAESNLNSQNVSPATKAAPQFDGNLPDFATEGFELDSSETSNSSEAFQQLLQRVATSTCIVLFLGVGFILVAKRWIGGANRAGNAPSRGSKTQRAEIDDRRIRIVSNLKLNSKSNLHLLEIGDQRVLVASDLNGIKSIVSLNHSFSSALQSLEEEETTSEAVATSEESVSPAGVYTPASRRSSSAAGVNSAAQTQQSNAEIEAEMQRKLSEILGGEAFKDVFYKSTRAVA